MEDKKEAPKSSKATKPTTDASSDGSKPRRVQWAADTHNPAKIKLGKANLRRDLLIFGGTTSFLLFVAYLSSDIGNVNKKKDRRPTIQDLRERLAKNLEVTREREEARKRKTECSLFLATSSIPGAGIGIFAGRRFGEGDQVELPGLFFPMNREATDATMYISQLGLLLKHHPFLSNLEGSLTWTEDRSSLNPTANSVYRATTTIEPGHELFLRFDDHPQRVLGFASGLPDIPTLDDYQLADKIVQDEIKTERRGGAYKRNKRNSPAAGGCTSSLALVKRAVELFNKRAASLLPGTTKALETRDLLNSFTAFSALTNMTLHKLELDGQCLDDVLVTQSGVVATQQGLFAQRAIKKGNIIVPAPLYALRRDSTCVASDESSCVTTKATNHVKYCFGREDSTLLLCPLSAASFVKSLPDGVASTSTKPNAAVKWSARINVNGIRAKSIDEILQNYTSSLAFNILALRNIEPGEEILLDPVSDTSMVDGPIHIPDGIYSDEWKDLAELVVE